MINIPKLSPFRHFCVTVGNIPTSYKDSLTYYEMLEWLCKYLSETVIPAVNTNAEAVTELQNLYTQLKNYVDNYFESLDIQEEINRKLDVMAEDGTLADIIAEYIKLKGILAYNSVSDMKLAENLVDGSFAETYGFYSNGDGGSAKYKIREIINTDVVNEKTLIALSNENLVAELIIEDNMNPIQFGAYGDGIHDDTESLNLCLASDNNLISENNKIYLCSDTININKRKNINFGLSTLKFTNNTDGVIVNMEDESPYSHNRFAPTIENLVVDCGNLNRGIYVDYAYKGTMRNIYVNNFLNIGIEKNRGYEMNFDDIWVWASNQNTTSIGLLVTGNDCEFGNIFGINCHTGIKMVGGGNHFKSIHMWLFNDTQGDGMLDGTALYTDSAMIEIAGNDRYFIDYCYVDSYEYGIKYNGYGEVFINSILEYCPSLSSLTEDYLTLPIYLIYAEGDKLNYIWRIVIDNLRYYVTSGNTVTAKVIPDSYSKKPLRFGKKIIPYDVDNIPKDYIDRFTIQNADNLNLKATPMADGKLRLHGIVHKDGTNSTIVIPYPDSSYTPETVNEVIPCITSASQYGTSPSIAMMNTGSSNIALLSTPVANNYYFIDVTINVSYY